MKRTPQAQYERDFTALKHYLIGRGYTEALRALGIAVRWHVGFRKDKVTPELHHQIWVCFNFLNAPIKGLTPLMEERALSALLDHDVVEDYPVTFDSLRKDGLKPLTIDLIKGLTKVEDETDAQFFERLLSHWLLPILKACDRDNNVMTMQGAFAIPKMKTYIEETRKYILVLLKKASNLYPEHHRSYSALATGIKKQLHIYEGFIASAEATETQRFEEAEQLRASVRQAGIDLHREAERVRELEKQVAQQTDTLNGIDTQVNALIAINEQLRVAAAAKRGLTIEQAAKIMKAVGCTHTQSYEFLRTAQLLISGKGEASLLNANENAEAISDPGATVDLSGTVFRTA